MNKFFILLISVLCFSCNQSSKSDQNKKFENKSVTNIELTENIDWLIGNWKKLNEEPGKETFEYWQKISPNEYSGVGFTMQEGDTISQEKMNFTKINGKWTLFVKMPNDKEATKFEKTKMKNNEFVCVNDSIDFPNSIHYWLDGNNMKAKISNNEIEISFEFEKIN